MPNILWSKGGKRKYLEFNAHYLRKSGECSKPILIGTSANGGGGGGGSRLVIQE